MKPKNLTEAINYYFPYFKGMEEYFNKSEDSFAAFCHSQMSGGIGMKIRNEMGFWTQDSELYQYMINEEKLEHPDDMSDVIIRGVYKKFKESI